ncbi:uncharacterized protein [Prorops nasuta]|uniref:uncharacterized protein n=1 Tax=Prorops nasuta TaxID=863751 RepID=UPI0034D00E2B
MAPNSASILSAERTTENYETSKTIKADHTVKILGLLWRTESDSFGFNIQQVPTPNQRTTKREVLSYLARLFDPLGWLAPVIVRAKILLQDLWILKIDWDTPLPEEVLKKWNSYCLTLPGIADISVNRWLGSMSTSKCELHGFADSSKRAYAAAIYIRTFDRNGEGRVSLLIAKSKVAPVKTVSIPNLELCGAVLLVKLFKHIQQLDLFRDLPVTAWSDSRDVLAWIRKHPSHLKVFVANRVSYIQIELPKAVWKYIPSRNNPADLATRGLDSSTLKASSLWWNGPDWLQESAEHWPEQPINVKPVEECVKAFTVTYGEVIIVRVITELVKKVQVFLNTRELENTRIAVIRLAQRTAFLEELNCLKHSRPIAKSSVIYKLRPFLDDQGVIRVGGRLTHSALQYPAKHPPILPKSSNLSQLYIRYTHRVALHAGPTLTLGTLLQQVWVIGATGLVKRHVRACVRCFRARPYRSTQLMGNLPSARVTPSRPFAITGVDYAGPLRLRYAKGRGQRTYKGYIALFVCFATKAIHLEAVSDMTTQSFLAAFRRFTCRRGLCQKLVSDNGTNFQGADKELRNLFKKSSEFYQDIGKDLAEQGIFWEFIPPSSPHFGGLWEAGVKATKHHLIRVIGDHTLTYEELATVLTEVEVCLNSRPLCPLSGDVEDLQVLTPSHFLLGGPSRLIPEVSLQSVPENRLTRFQLMTRIQQHFWKRWSKEYLHHLQERSKWRDVNDNFAVGQLVVVQDDRYPPAKWPLGRILEVHPGEDGVVRVVTLKTASTVLKRPIVRLSPLPLSKESTDSRRADGTGSI